MTDIVERLKDAENATHALFNHIFQDAREEIERLRAKVAEPAPSVPDGWFRAVDEALVVTHLGVANESDTYEQAREKLNKLIGWYTGVAIDPAVNGGYKLMPVEPTKEIYECFAAYDGSSYSNPFDFDDFSVDYRLAIEAAPNERSESPENKS